MKYSDLQRIDKIIELTEKLIRYINDNNITQEQVENQEIIRWTITTPLYNIGEHAYNLSEDFKAKHDNIPWNKISGLRHRLVHDYENTKWNLICTIIFDVLPDFLTALREARKTID